MPAERGGSDGLEVRVASVGDAGALARLGANLFEQAFAEANSPENLRSYVSAAFSNTRQLEELTDPDRVAWLATIDNQRPIGFAMVRRGRRW
jgi:hypothetical protein